MTREDHMRVIGEYLLKYYRPEEFPALYRQIEEWSKSRPLEGIRILDSTPVFRNTLAKYWALLAAGANVTVSGKQEVIRDPLFSLMEFPKFCEVPFLTMGSPAWEEAYYDIILDCGGLHSQVKPKLGFVELTRSGYDKYRNSWFPVYLVDGGVIKTIETTLGTGDGFVRGMAYFGYDDLRDREILVFGYGKVGKGIALASFVKGAKVIVVDKASVRDEGIFPGLDFINMDDLEAIRDRIKTAFCLVSATGVKNALEGICPVESLMESSALVANMGVEDEWGPTIPESRVLNRKKALNFVLDEPTQMKYIDATMALSNWGAVRLIESRFKCGISLPEKEVEERIIEITKEKGIISDELRMLGL